MVANAYACRDTHTRDFIVGTLTDLWDRLWKQMQDWKKSWMLTGEDFNYFDTYEMKWNDFRKMFVPGKSQELSEYSECQTNARNRPFFNAERNQGSVSRPSESRGGLLLVSAMQFWDEMDPKKMVNGEISMIWKSLRASFLPAPGRYVLLLLICQICN